MSSRPTLLAVYVDYTTLHVLSDRPSPPVNVSIRSCEASSAVLSWNPGFNNNDIITGFTVYYNTSFDGWGQYKAIITTNATMATISLLPWRRYTFHVRSRNRFGFSDRSASSQEECVSAPAIPASHPRGVCTRSRGAHQLVIVWQVNIRTKYAQQEYYTVNVVSVTIL